MMCVALSGGRADRRGDSRFPYGVPQRDAAAAAAVWLVGRNIVRSKNRTLSDPARHLMKRRGYGNTG